jgi:hypothetical protein
MGVAGINSYLASQIQNTQPQQNLNFLKAEEQTEIEKIMDERFQNVGMKTGMSALKEALENDPVANFVSYLA